MHHAGRVHAPRTATTSVVSPQPPGPAAGSPIGIYPLLHSGFGTEETAEDGSVVFRLHGELDMATAPLLARSLSTTLDTGPSSVALDLSELTFVDSTGLNAFVTASRRADRIGCSFTLRSPRRAVLRTLRLTGLDGRINISIGDAVL